MHGELPVGNFGFGEAGLLHLGLEVAVELIQGGVHIVGDLVVEVLQELGEHVFGAVVQVELIGVREEVALQAAVVAVVEILEEVIVKLVVGGGLLKLLHGAHALFLEQLEDVIGLIALGDGDLGGGAVFGGGNHAIDEGVVVVDLVELIGAGVYLILSAGDHAVEAEEPAVVHQALLHEDVGHLGHGGVFRHGDGDHIVLGGEGAYLVGTLPGEHSKKHRRGQHAADVQQHLDGGGQPQRRRLFLILQLFVGGEVGIFRRERGLEGLLGFGCLPELSLGTLNHGIQGEILRRLLLVKKILIGHRCLRYAL